MQFADASLGLIINKLKAKGLYEETLIIVSSKHGQAPINPALFNEVDPALFTTQIGVNTSFITVRASFFLKSNRSNSN
jgi:predicted AlkP superfamily pyrophosphatase or phosphodiesterase